MRSIGRKNIALVVSETKRALEQEKQFYPSPLDIEGIVIDWLPSSLWDIWESADNEIKNIIHDTINGRR